MQKLVWFDNFVWYRYFKGFIILLYQIFRTRLKNVYCKDSSCVSCALSKSITALRINIYGSIIHQAPYVLMTSVVIKFNMPKH